MPARRILGAALAAMLSLTAPATAQPIINELWPNQDGLSWTYAQRHDALQYRDPRTYENRTRIFLDGTVVAPTAIQAQYLRQEVISGATVATASEPEILDPFLRQLWNARPDLRTRIMSKVANADCPQNNSPGAYSVLLNGEFAFVKTQDEIAAWRCNAPDTRSWLWLVSGGGTFTLQLVPDLADDVFLHGKFSAIETVTVPAGTFKECVRVDYTIDYGWYDCSPNNPNSGRDRSETRGYVHYAPGVGPVQSFEEWFPWAEDMCPCIHCGAMTRTTLKMDTTPTPVRRASWGQIKLVYR